MSRAATEALKPSTKKITLVELDLGQGQTTWFNYSAFTYYVDFDAVYDRIDASLLTGVVAQTIINVGSVSSDASPLQSETAVASVESTEMTFYYDAAANRLYVHLQNGDEPSMHRIIIGIVYGVANHGGIYNGMIYEPRLLSAPQISKRKDPLFFGKISNEGGWISIDNTDGFFDRMGEDNDVFGNDVRVLQGFDDLDYADFVRCAGGRIGTLRIGPEVMEVEMQDGRKSWSLRVPTSVFTTGNYPDLAEFNGGRSIPLAYGTCRHAPCVCTNEEEAGGPSAFTFVIADTTNHELHAITTVYVTNQYNKAIVKVPASKNLATGSFVLASAMYSPGQTVTADIEGFEDAGAGTPIENALDVIMDLLTTYLGYEDSATQFDQAEWATAKALAPNIGLLIKDPQEIADVVQDICSSTNIAIIKKDDGRLTARKYNPNRAVSQRFKLEDLLEVPTIRYEPDEVLSSTIVRYARNWNDGDSIKLHDTSQEAAIFAKYKTYRERDFDTLLTTLAAAQTFSDDVMSLSVEVARWVTLRMKMQPLEREVMDFIDCWVVRQSGTGLLGQCKAEILGITKDFTAAEITLDCRIVEIYPDTMQQRGWYYGLNTYYGTAADGARYSLGGPQEV